MRIPNLLWHNFCKDWQRNLATANKLISEALKIQGIGLRPFPGLVNFVPAVAYIFCLNLLAAFSQPGNDHIVQPCSIHHAVLERRR